MWRESTGQSGGAARPTRWQGQTRSRCRERNAGERRRIGHGSETRKDRNGGRVSPNRRAYTVSPDDAWGTCTQQSAADPMTGHSYLYGTKDGGITWRPLMGAP